MKWKIGNVKIDNQIVLAPMAGICDSAFRRIVKSMGCGLIETEMVSDKAIMYDNYKTKEMLYIGDHPLNDIDGSRNAGCIPVWVKTTGIWTFPEVKKPDLQVDTVKEIPQLIKQINER